MSHILFLPSEWIVTSQLAPSLQDECLLLIFVLSVLAQVIFVPSRDSLGATGNVGFPVYSCSSVGVLYYITLCVGKLSVFYFTVKNVFCCLTTMLLFATLFKVTWFALLCTAALYKLLTQTQTCFFSLALSLDTRLQKQAKSMCLKHSGKYYTEIYKQLKYYQWKTCTKWVQTRIKQRKNYI